MSFAKTSFSGAAIDSIAPKIPTRQIKTTITCQALSNRDQSRRQVFGLGAILAFAAITPIAKADLIEDLKAKSDANKELNDRKRLATSYANLARSRTVTDGTCTYPSNFFGCDNASVAGDVKYISDDIKIECQGKSPGKCGSHIDF